MEEQKQGTEDMEVDDAPMQEEMQVQQEEEKDGDMNETAATDDKGEDHAATKSSDEAAKEEAAKQEVAKEEAIKQEAAKQEAAKTKMAEEAKVLALSHFDSLCQKIEKNDEKFKIYDFEMLLNDDMAVQLGRALNGNTHLHLLRIMVGQDLTVRGSRALVGGMMGSQVQYPVVQASQGLPLDFSPLYTQPMQNAEHMLLSFVIDDVAAANIGEALTTAESLQDFAIQVQGMSPQGAQLLAKGIGGARNLTDLHISVRPAETVSSPAEVMRTILREGVQRSTTIRKLELNRIIGDVHSLVKVLPKLYKLVMKSISLSDEMAELLGAALKKNKSLEYVGIPVQGMTNQAAQSLSDGTRTSRSIKTLELSLSEDENVGQEIMKTFLLQGVYGARAIQNLTLVGTVGDLATLELVLPGIHELSIQNVPVSVADTETISRAVAKTKKLHSLAINGCSLTCDHMHVLTAILMTHAPLKNVDVSRNQIGDYGVAAMILNYSSDWVKDQKWNYNDNGTMFDR